MHNEELHNLYASPNIIKVIIPRRMGWAGHVPCMGGGGERDRRNAYRILVGKSEGKKLVRR
jgi:hypothetical protein